MRLRALRILNTRTLRKRLIQGQARGDCRRQRAALQQEQRQLRTRDAPAHCRVLLQGAPRAISTLRQLPA